MPQGKGTYGSKIGRPIKKMNMGGHTGDMMYSRGYGVDERGKRMPTELMTAPGMKKGGATKKAKGGKDGMKKGGAVKRKQCLTLLVTYHILNVGYVKSSLVII